MLPKLNSQRACFLRAVSIYRCEHSRTGSCFVFGTSRCSVRVWNSNFSRIIGITFSLSHPSLLYPWQCFSASALNKSLEFLDMDALSNFLRILLSSVPFYIFFRLLHLTGWETGGKLLVAAHSIVPVWIWIIPLVWASPAGLKRWSLP